MKRYSKTFSAILCQTTIHHVFNCNNLTCYYQSFATTHENYIIWIINTSCRLESADLMTLVSTIADWIQQGNHLSFGALFYREDNSIAKADHFFWLETTLQPQALSISMLHENWRIRWIYLIKNHVYTFSRVRPTLRHYLLHQLFKSFLFFLESNPTYAKHIKNKVISFWYVFDFHYLCTKINILYKIRYDFIFQNSIKERDCHRSGPSTQSRWD